MNLSQLKTFTILHFIANMILAAICILFMIRAKVDVKELISWTFFLFISGLVTAFLTKRKIWVYLLIFLILVPLIIPVMYASMKGILPGELVLIDGMCLWFIQNMVNQLEMEKHQNDDN